MAIEQDTGRAITDATAFTRYVLVNEYGDYYTNKVHGYEGRTPRGPDWVACLSDAVLYKRRRSATAAITKLRREEPFFARMGNRKPLDPNKCAIVPVQVVVAPHGVADPIAPVRHSLIQRAVAWFADWRANDAAGGCVEAARIQHHLQTTIEENTTHAET